MFEDTFEKEMGKYDRFRGSLEEGETVQKDLLAQLKVSCLPTLLASQDTDA